MVGIGVTRRVRLTGRGWRKVAPIGAWSGTCLTAVVARPLTSTASVSTGETDAQAVRISDDRRCGRVDFDRLEVIAGGELAAYDRADTDLLIAYLAIDRDIDGDDCRSQTDAIHSFPGGGHRYAP